MDKLQYLTALFSVVSNRIVDGFSQLIVNCQLSIVNCRALCSGLFLLLLCSCASYHYVSIESFNPAVITFPEELRRVLIVNNALPQEEVPFESTMRQLPDSIIIIADSTTFDFCNMLGEALAEFQGFDDVRLLEGCFRKDSSPLSALTLKREEVEQLCDEHEVDVVISLDRLLFRLNEYEGEVSGIDITGLINVEVSGVLRVYIPTRDTPMTTILLSDTITPNTWMNWYNLDFWDLYFDFDPTNLIRESARYNAYEARKHFVPYWIQDVRWYYVSFESQWKEASAYAESEKWDEALAIWLKLYDRTSSRKQKARLASNIALGEELTGDLEKALEYATIAYQYMLHYLGEDDALTKKQEVYVRVLSSRVAENPKLRLQMR